MGHQAALVILLPLILLGPGTAALATSGCTRVLHPLLWPAGALLATIALAAPALAATLATRSSILLFGMLLTAGCVVMVVAARCVRGTFWNVDTSALVQALDRTGGYFAAMAAAVALLALVAGAHLDNDVLYHIGVAERLAWSPSPGFDVTSRFSGGDMNPPYALPTWHGLVALAARLAGVPAATAVWIVPFVQAPIFLLTAMGVVMTLARRASIALSAGVGVALLGIVLPAPDFPLFTIVPGEIVIAVAAPVALVIYAEMLELASTSDGRTKRSRRLVGALLVCVVVATNLHGNYLFFMALLIAGYLLGRVAGGVWPSGSIRVAARATVVAGTLVALGVASLVPIVRQLQHFARGTDDEVKAELFERFSHLYVEDTGGGFHLLPSALLAPGGLTVLLVPAALLAVLVLRRPLAWLVTGPTLLVLVVSQSGTLFPLLLGAGSTTVGLRLGRTLPLAASFALAVAVIIGVALGIRASKPRRIAMLVVVAGAGLVTYAAGELWPRDGTALGTIGTFAYPALPVRVALIGVGAALACACAIRWNAWRRRNHGSSPSWRQPPPAVDAIARTIEAPGMALTVVVLASVLVGASASLGRAYSETSRRLAERPASALAVDRLRDYPTSFLVELRREPADSILLAPTAAGYNLLAAAPIRTVGDQKYWLVDTVANCTRERRQATLDFFANATTDAERDRIARSWGADIIAMPSDRYRAANRWADRHVRSGALRRKLSGAWGLYELKRPARTATACPPV